MRRASAADWESRHAQPIEAVKLVRAQLAPLRKHVGHALREQLAPSTHLHLLLRLVVLVAVIL